MNNTQILLETWQTLTVDKQQEVVDFMQFLQQKYQPKIESLNQDKQERLEKIQKIQNIRDKIVADGESLLNADEIEREILGGNNTKLKQCLHLTPADKGSGKSDISINHDQIISEQSEHK